MSVIELINKRKKLASLTTAIYPNRIRNKNKLESITGLYEFGDINTAFYSLNGTLIFVGYDRIVYGDHGPYVEFSKEQLVTKTINKFNNKTPIDAYYEWQTVDDNSDVKIYWQLRDVKHLPNPPAGGFRGNRKEGYADYLPNKYYISPNELIVKKVTK